MNELPFLSRNPQWKWVGISMVLYIVFYFVPLLYAEWQIVVVGASTGFEIFRAIWIFAGIVVVAAAAGYLSQGVTILEPAIASVLSIVLWLITFVLFFPGGNFSKKEIFPTIGILAAVFLASLIGAWLGEKAQKLWKPRESS